MRNLIKQSLVHFTTDELSRHKDVYVEPENPILHTEQQKNQQATELKMRILANRRSISE